MIKWDLPIVIKKCDHKPLPKVTKLRHTEMWKAIMQEIIKRVREGWEGTPYFYEERFPKWFQAKFVRKVYLRYSCIDSRRDTVRYTTMGRGPKGLVDQSEQKNATRTTAMWSLRNQHLSLYQLMLLTSWNGWIQSSLQIFFLKKRTSVAMEILDCLAEHEAPTSGWCLEPEGTPIIASPRYLYLHFEPDFSPPKKSKSAICIY